MLLAEAYYIKNGYIVSTPIDDFHEYDLIVDTKTNRCVFEYVRVLNPKGIYASVGGTASGLLRVLFFGPLFKIFLKKKIQIVALKLNKDLLYMNELFEAGKVKPIIDGSFKLTGVPEAMRYFGEGKHKGKVVISIINN